MGRAVELWALKEGLLLALTFSLWQLKWSLMQPLLFSEFLVILIYLGDLSAPVGDCRDLLVQISPTRLFHGYKVNFCADVLVKLGISYDS